MLGGEGVVVGAQIQRIKSLNPGPEIASLGGHCLVAGPAGLLPPFGSKVVGITPTAQSISAPSRSWPWG